MDKFDRIFQLHNILSSRRNAIPGEDLRTRLQCSKSTLLRTINALKEGLGAPIVFDQYAGYRYVNVGPDKSYKLRELPLTQNELRASSSRSHSWFNQGSSQWLLEHEVGGLARRLDDLAQHQRWRLTDAMSSTVRGALYEISDQLIVPSTDIQVVAPKIEVIGEALATRLKGEPQSVYNLSSREFEYLVAELLSDMGWEVSVTRATRDGGKDILAFLKTEFGKLLCIVETKKYRRDRKVGIAAVRSLYGSLADAGASTSMLVTSSTFSSEARAFASKHEYTLSLRGYEDLVRWITQYKRRSSSFKNNADCVSPCTVR